MPELTARYCVSVWDMDAQTWKTYACGCKLWTLRRVLRRLYSRGYSSFSVLVEREEKGEG